MHVQCFDVFKNRVSLDMTCKIVHFDFHFQITLNVKSQQKSKQLFKYMIVCYLNAS